MIAEGDCLACLVGGGQTVQVGSEPVFPLGSSLCRGLVRRVRTLKPPDKVALPAPKSTRFNQPGMSISADCRLYVTASTASGANGISGRELLKPRWPFLADRQSLSARRWHGPGGGAIALPGPRPLPLVSK